MWDETLIAELRRTKRASGAPWVIFFGKSPGYPCEKFWLWRQQYVRPPVETVGVEVGRQDSLWGWESSSGNFTWREIAWQWCWPNIKRLLPMLKCFSNGNPLLPVQNPFEPTKTFLSVINGAYKVAKTSFNRDCMQLNGDVAVPFKTPIFTRVS